MALRFKNLANLFRGRGAHDHGLGVDAAHLGRLEVAQEDGHPVLHLILRDELHETYKG